MTILKTWQVLSAAKSLAYTELRSALAGVHPVKSMTRPSSVLRAVSKAMTLAGVSVRDKADAMSVTELRADVLAHDEEKRTRSLAGERDRIYMVRIDNEGMIGPFMKKPVITIETIERKVIHE